ncbi:hypothetical protein Tco_0843988 [Tanacetum coccineum]
MIYTTWVSSTLELNGDEERVASREALNFSESLALGWHLEEIYVTWAHLEKKRTITDLRQDSLRSIVLRGGDGIAGIKRRRDLSGDGVWILATAS